MTKCLGKNIIEADIAISRHLTVENFYLLGNFGVTVSGADKLITKPKEYLTFGSAVNQGLSFYGGNIRYKIKVNTPEGYLKIHANFYRGALIKVLVDGKDIGNIIFAPYSVYTDKLPAGNHGIELIIYGNRYNTFAGLHNVTNDNFYSPLYWRTEGDGWCYEYRLKDMGIMSAPVISVFTDGKK